MSELKRAIGVGVLFVSIVAGMALLAEVATRGSDEFHCGHFRPLSPSVVPVPFGFRVITNGSVEPEGCGDVYKRDATLAFNGSPREISVRDRYVRSLVTTGWKSAGCSFQTDRCFQRQGLFVAVSELATNQSIRVWIEPA